MKIVTATSLWDWNLKLGSGRPLQRAGPQRTHTDRAHTPRRWNTRKHLCKGSFVVAQIRLNVQVCEIRGFISLPCITLQKAINNLSSVTANPYHYRRNGSAVLVPLDLFVGSTKSKESTLNRRSTYPLWKSTSSSFSPE
ncbi:hypothetical protein CLAIMM_00272, partial [Cladophialophora immunda]